MRIATTGVCAGLAMTGFLIMKDSMIFKMSVRIYQDENKVFGPGIAQLLHRVRELHSLRAAANSMNMAYSKAWTVLRTAENALGYKLLYSSAGGKNGGGAVLPPGRTAFGAVRRILPPDAGIRPDSVYPAFLR